MGTKVNRKHIVLAVPLVLGGAVFLASGLPSLVATVFYAGFYQSLFPSSVSWDGHGAYVKCDGAIAGGSPWPAAPPAKAAAAPSTNAPRATQAMAGRNRAAR